MYYFKKQERIKYVNRYTHCNYVVKIMRQKFSKIVTCKNYEAFIESEMIE